MSYFYRSLGSVLMLILSISLIQWHSIQFWLQVTDSTGWLWSIAIEAAGIWLWWQRYTTLACLASFILIAGPVCGLAFPMVEAASQYRLKNLQRSSRLSAIKQEMGQLEESLASYQHTSQSRVGWAARIDKTQAKLNTAYQRFDHLLKETSKPFNFLKLVLVITIEIAALSTLLLTQILIVRNIRNVSFPMLKSETPPDTNINSPPRALNNTGQGLSVNRNEQDDNETMAYQMAKQLSDILREEGVSQAEWGRRNDVSAKNISLLLNCKKRKKLGLEGISKRELKRIHNILNA